MPFLLMVFLTVACLPAWEKPPGPVHSVGMSAALTWLGVALTGLEALWSARGVRRALARDPARRERVTERFERRRFWRQLLLVGAYALYLYAFSWGWAAGQMWSWDGAGRAPMLGVKVLVLAPFFVSLFLSWVFAYDADRALYVAAYRLVKGDALAHSLLESAPAAAPASARDPGKDFGGRWSYVGFQARQKLALVFLPIVLLIAQQEAGLQIGRLAESLHLSAEAQAEWAEWLSMAGAVAVAGVLFSLPWMVRLALGLRPLPAGPTRDRLTAAARRLRFRCSDILYWDTRGGMANAMVIGVLPWPRYVIFTDRFLEEFSDDEAEAVFGHEVGHVKHHHMLLYLAFLMLSMGVAGYACVALAPWLPGPANASLTAALDGWPVSDAWLPALAAPFLGYVLVVFGFLSRRCERQADVYGCRAVSCGRPDCPGHDEGTVLAPGGCGLCPTGVRIFIHALEKVALVNGMSRDRPGFFQSWQHGSIARRVAFLYGTLEDPAAEPRFQRRVAVVKWGLVGALAAALAALVAVCPASEESKPAANDPPEVAPEVVPNAGLTPAATTLHG